MISYVQSFAYDFNEHFTLHFTQDINNCLTVLAQLHSTASTSHQFSLSKWISYWT